MSEFTLHPIDGTLRLTLAGDLTATLVPTLQCALREAMTPEITELEVDLQHTRMLDSSGMSLLIAAANTLARRQGRIRVIQVSADILQLLQSMRLAQRLNVTAAQA